MKTVLLDTTSLQDDSRLRGIGRYVAELMKMEDPEGLLSLRFSDAPGAGSDLADPIPGWMTPLKNFLKHSDLVPESLKNTLRFFYQWKKVSNRQRLGNYGKLGKDIDILHFPANYLPTRTFTYPALKVVTVADVIPFSYNRGEQLNYFIKRSYYSCRMADVIITVSEFSKREIVKHIKVEPNKVHVIPLGADHFQMPSALPEVRRQQIIEKYRLDLPYYLYLGVLEPRKNIINIIRAFSRVAAEVPEQRIFFIGSYDDYQKACAREAARCGVADKVHFLGYLEDRDVVHFYDQADAFVFPSLYEGFGLPVLEAMRFGTAVITSNTTSLAEVSGDAAHLVDPQNVDELAEALRRLHVDEGYRRALAEKGQRRAAQYRWDHTRQRTMALYKSLLFPYVQPALPVRAQKAGGTVPPVAEGSSLSA